MTQALTRQQKRRKEREAEVTPGTETLAYKQSTLEGLISVQGLVGTRTLSIREQDRIENIRGGLGYALQKVVEHAQHMEIDLKIAAIREEIDIYKNGLKEEKSDGNAENSAKTE